MDKNTIAGVSNFLADAVEAVQRTLLPWLLEPSALITGASERRQARLVSALLLVTSLSMISGVIYMRFFSPSPMVAWVLAGADIVMATAYALSRTRHSQPAALLALTVLAIIPVLNVALTNDHSSEGLLVLLVWNSLTILLSSAMTRIRFTALFSVINILTLLLFPVFIRDISLASLEIPLIFSAVISLLILVFSHQRNMLERERLLEIKKINAQLQVELKHRKRAEDALTHAALHDPLTDLPNRVLFVDRVSHAIEYAKRNKDYQFAVFFIDLDRFKNVNDSLGHNIGDLLLVQTAQRLAGCLRSNDTVARLGGDEFVILLDGVQGPTYPIRVAERIQNELIEPFELEGYNIHVFMSMGIVVSNEGYEQADDILRDADIAMYLAKGQGLGRFEIFNPVMRDQVMSRIERETDLRKAVEAREFIIHYQPVFEMKNHRIIGFEALVRWQHPKKGLIQPAEFIQNAEETGLIIPIGYWVLEEACRQIRLWQTQFPAQPPLTISVNLSTRQFTEPNLVQRIKDTLAHTGLEASSLELELTESLIISDTKSISTMLVELREIGVRVQIDDFGTGYSSLSYLHKLPIDTLKIDRSFINRLGPNGSNADIVRTIAALAHNLGLKVVAEGVETDDQFDALKAMDCEYMQGFLFARPVENHAAAALLKKAYSRQED